jgi:hypothetical protein
MKTFFQTLRLAASVGGSVLTILCVSADTATATEFCEIKNVLSQTDAFVDAAIADYGKRSTSLLDAMNELADKAKKPGVAIGRQLSAADLNKFTDLRNKLALIGAQKMTVSNFQRDVHVLAEIYRVAEFADLYDVKAEALGSDDPRKFYLTILEMVRIAQPRTSRTSLVKSDIECDLEAALFLMEEFNQQQLAKNGANQRLVNLVFDIERLRTLYQLFRNLLDKGLAEFRAATWVGDTPKFPSIIQPYIATSFPATQLMYKHVIPYITQQHPSEQALVTAFLTQQKNQIEKDYPASKGN